MTTSATVIYVMIASPGDVSEARETAYRALARWNEANTRGRGIVLVPLRWETSTVPQLGDHPQSIINQQLLADADVVVALFGSRIGSATPAAISGTAEEIDHAVASGKPVHLWFSSAPHPNDVDPEQLASLRKFEQELRSRGLYGTFANTEELVAHIWHAIESDIRTLALEPAVTTSAVERRERPRLLAQARQESYSETDARGKLRSKTRRWVEVQNTGGDDAEAVRVVSKSDRVRLFEGDLPRTLAAGQSRRYPIFLMPGGDDSAQIEVAWIDAGEEYRKRFEL